MNCAYCHGGLGLSAVTCLACQTAVHSACAALHGECVTLGCSGSRYRPGLPQERSISPKLPGLPPLRAGLHAALAIALAPSEDPALVVLGLGGLLGLLAVV